MTVWRSLTPTWPPLTVSYILLVERTRLKYQLGDFDGLTALETLDLSGAGFTSLEAGVFDGLTSLTVLDLRAVWYTSRTQTVFGIEHTGIVWNR